MQMSDSFDVPPGCKSFTVPASVQIYNLQTKNKIFSIFTFVICRLFLFRNLTIDILKNTLHILLRGGMVNMKHEQMA